MQMKARSLLSLVVISLMVSFGAANAQEPSILRGRVIDAVTLNPVYLAFVAPSGASRGSLSDSLGRFILEAEPSQSYNLTVTQLGYDDLEVRLPADSVLNPFTLHLSPNPVELEGLTVLAERLEGRRAGPFGVAEILTREQLLAAPGGSAYDLVIRTMPFLGPCGPYSEALCLEGRTRMGEKRPIQVCLDDHKVFPEMIETALAGVDPRSLYLVEVYSRAGEIRMYTPSYIKRLLAIEGSLPPLSFGCRGGVG